MSNKTEDKISIYKLETPQEILDYYKKWSQNNNYEKDLIKYYPYFRKYVCEAIRLYLKSKNENFKKFKNIA